MEEASNDGLNTIRAYKTKRGFIFQVTRLIYRSSVSAQLFMCQKDMPHNSLHDFIIYLSPFILQPGYTTRKSVHIFLQENRGPYAEMSFPYLIFAFFFFLRGMIALHNIFH